MDTTLGRLSDSQVRSLLGFGLMPSPSHIGELLSELSDASRETAVSDALNDLQLPIGSICQGPLSLQRLTSLPDGEIESLRAKSSLAAVTDGKTSRLSLLALCEYGDLLQDERFPDSTQLTGALLSAMANVALWQHHGIDLTAADTDSVHLALEALASSPSLSGELKNFITETRSALL